jgi:hypothetical protein
MAKRAIFMVFLHACLLFLRGPITVYASDEEDVGYYDESAYYDDVDNPEQQSSTTELENRLHELEEEQETERMKLLEKKLLEMRQHQEQDQSGQEDQARKEAEQQQQQQQKVAKTTYKKSVGGGLGRVSVVLATEKFITTTAAQYGCILQSQLGVKQQSKNATKIQRSLQENEKRQQEEFGKVVIDGDGGTQHVPPPTAAAKEKKMSYRELQEQKREQRLKAEMEKEALKGKFDLGVSCETLVCGACKVMVEEFADAVLQGLADPRYVYVEDLLSDFCQRKEIAQKYSELVSSICFSIASDKGGYREAFLLPFEADAPDWSNVKRAEGLVAKKMQICASTVGACSATQFQFNRKPRRREEEHWDDKCHVCQAFALDVEERVQLSAPGTITESSIVSVVSDTCNRMYLPQDLTPTCAQLAQGKLLDDISWISKVHSEALIRKAKAEVSFADALCQEVGFCEKWLDPEELRKREEAKMDQVFF